MIKVFGHLSPDTDATTAAIIWAWYINEYTPNDATPYVLGELNSETDFVLKKWNVSVPEILEEIVAGDDVIIVDTNNPQELPANIENANIIEIIDHHKLVGGLQTTSPITITIRPTACTGTILHDLLHERNVVLTSEMKGLLLSAILSDTLGFRSPTTTPHDKDVAERLAKELSLEIETYADELFTAKSDISRFSDSGLITLDSKKYEVGGKNFRVSVVETTKPEIVLSRKEGIIEAIQRSIAEETDVDEVLFFIVDILKEEATVLTYNDLTKQIITSSFGVTVESDMEILPGIVSRKKQILPALTLTM
jgi:manganese-dependent inorganic pyrophosphatase